MTVRPEDGKFTSGNLSIELNVEGKQVTWHPGMTDTGNLQGTTRTLDGARGGDNANRSSRASSRAGWVLVDDSARPLFDSANFNFKRAGTVRGHGSWSVQRRPAGLVFLRLWT